jgi:hypothetical protein
LRIEIETLEIFLENHYPELEGIYSQLKDEAVEKMNPEKKDWVVSEHASVFFGDLTLS